MSKIYIPSPPGKIVIFILCVLVFILNMDITIVNMALPSLSTLPDSTDIRLQWIVASYALAAAVSVIPSGALLDRYGPRWIIAGATILFGIGSLCAAFSPTMILLNISRIIMGLASSAILTGSIAALTLYYKDEQKSRAFGLWSACAAVGLCAGPLIGGWILTTTSWGIIFLINVPLSFIAGIFIIFTIPPQNDLNKVKKIDIISISLLSIVLLTIIAGVIEFGAGRTTAAIALVIGSTVSFVTFLIRQRNPKTRILNPGTMRNGNIITPIAVLIVLFAVMSIILFLLPSSFELGNNQGSFLPSLYILPLPLAIAAATLFSGYFLHNLATSSNLYICLTAVALGLLLLLSQNPANPSGITVLGLICIGLGVGIGQPIALQAAVSSFAPEERGTGAGIVNSIRLAANAAGAAAAGGVLTLTMADARTADTLNNIVKGASSCGVLGSSTDFREASELCAVYTDGVKSIFLISLAMVFIVLITVILWDLNSKKKSVK